MTTSGAHAAEALEMFLRIERPEFPPGCCRCGTTTGLVHGVYVDPPAASR